MQFLTTSTTAVSEFAEFSIGDNSCYDRLKSIATCLRECSLHLVCHETIIGANYVKHAKPSFSNGVMKMLVIYKKEPFFDKIS